MVSSQNRRRSIKKTLKKTPHPILARSHSSAKPATEGQRFGVAWSFQGLQFPGHRSQARQRAKQQQELPALVWGSFWARKSWLPSLQRGQDGEPGASSTPSPPRLQLWHINFSLCTPKLKLIPGAAASQHSLSVTHSILQP